LAEGLPIIGGLISGLNSAVDAIYGKLKEKRLEDRVNAIVSIIMKNEDPSAQMAED